MVSNINFVLASLALLCLLIGNSDAKGLRMRGGVLGTSRNTLGRRSGNTWSSDRRNTYDDRRYGKRRRPGLGFSESDACVGLCYYMKLLEAKKKKEDTGGVVEKSPVVPKKRFGSSVKMPFKKPYPWEKSTEAPCVGLCYLYKKKGLDNPYKTWFKQTER